MRRRPSLGPALLLWGVTTFGAAHAQEAEQPAGSGEDLILLDQRVDLRVERSSTSGENELAITLRYDHRLELGNGWRLNLRADAPFKRVEEEDGSADFGRGDTLLQAVFVRRLSNGEGFGFGTQLILPTSVREQGERGKWRLRPIVGYRWPANGVTEGSFFQLQVRYDGSFGGGEDRRDTRELQFSPNLEIALPGRAYVSLFPSADLRYDFVHDELFIPVDVEIGKEWGRVIWSLEGAAGVIKGDHAPYDWRMETRVGYRF